MILVNLWIDTSNINSYISNILLSHIEETLLKWEKVILYLNKRGIFNCVICQDCQYIFQCSDCDINMSVHKYPAVCKCHLCGKSEDIPHICKKCQWVNLHHIWVWTQQIEEALEWYFNTSSLNNKGSVRTYSIFRFDTDSMKTKKSKLEAIEKLSQADIIIWTKMITTGFNFEKIWLIWVILLEQELQIPTYNTEESVYNNIRQLTWRWWRVWQKTHFIIQSMIPDNETVQKIVYSNYRDFFTHTLQERKLFHYPPFAELAILEYAHTSQQKSVDFMANIYTKIHKNQELDIIFNSSSMKKVNQFYTKIVIKWDNLRDNLQIIKSDIIRNRSFTITFE